MNSECELGWSILRGVNAYVYRARLEAEVVPLNRYQLAPAAPSARRRPRVALTKFVVRGDKVSQKGNG